MMKRIIWLLLSVSFLAGCRPGEREKPLFTLMEHTGIEFRNNVEDGSKDNSFLFRNFYNGGGVAIGDINNDGLADVFLTSNTGANKLYLNKGEFKFDDISVQSGIIQDDYWNTGVVFSDINNDGWLDIYVCASGHMSTGKRRNKLYINNRNLTFTESAAAYGLDIKGYTTQVSFFDYDLDGDLDCFMINNSPIPVNQLGYANNRDLPENEWSVAEFLKGGGDHLFRNDQGHFTEVTRQAGIHGSLISFGLGVSVTDINDDGYPDVFVSNDSYERDYLYINQKDGTFRDELENWMQHVSFSSMGADIADINNDGYPDLFTTDMFPMGDHRLKTMGAFDNIDLFNAKLRAGFYYQYPVNSLQLNSGNGLFRDIARYAGVPATDWSWGALMFDMDNDGWMDLYVCNGVNRDVTNLDFMNFFADEVYHNMVLTGQKKAIDQLLQKIPRTPLPNKAFRNAHDLTFSDQGEAWGLNQPTFSNGAAYGDLDNDGDLDLVVSNENQPSFVYRNNATQLTGHHYLALSLRARGPNHFAIGSKIRVYAGGQLLSRELVPSRGFQSCMDYKQTIGLGTINQVDSVVITWPDRTVTTLGSLPVDMLSIVNQPPSAEVPASSKPSWPQPFFTTEPSGFDKHEENEVIDFYNERNIPRLLSREGPHCAVGDVNGDGRDDLFIGGTPGHPGQLYLQLADGRFEKKPQPALAAFSEFEDVAVTLFDCDQDQDLDLLIGPGGNQAPVNSRELQLRLFKNDGKGDFSIDTRACPNTGMNVSVVIANDFTGDGYPDLFVGGRSYPGIYGSSPRSFLLVNDRQGRFTDQTTSLLPEIESIGMVCSAEWADLTGDGSKELVVVGEWMAPRIFEYKGNKFTEIPTNLNSLHGWWQSVKLADLNGDGRQDLVLGNIGENFYLRPDAKNPVKLWINDFDQNGSVEKIMTSSINGKDMPVFLKKDMEDQLPSIKKQNLKNEVYADKSIQEIFPAALLGKSIIRQFDYPSSCVAYNQGNGQFRIEKLPAMSQLSCINVIRVLDVNEDGRPDLVTGGNQFGFLPQFEKLDASFGDVLLNDGKGGWRWQESAKTGLRFRGEMRDIGVLKLGDKTGMVFLQNNQYPVLCVLNGPEDRQNGK